MLTIGLLREEKVPVDNRVALTPLQCKQLLQQYPFLRILVQSSPERCYKDAEYKRKGLDVVTDLGGCDILIGIKEVATRHILHNKTYLFFSHTRKKQPYNRQMLQTLIQQNNTLIDYECLEHEDGQRIIGFGFFAGIVGAHNGMMAYGERTGAYNLGRVYKEKDFKTLIHTYFGVKLPNVKVAITGSGRVAHGIIEVMNLMGVIEVEKDEFLTRDFAYPVFVQLKGADLYLHQTEHSYSRNHFHQFPQQYRCLFNRYLPYTDILMNGIYWDINVPRLFNKEELSQQDCRLQVIADITDDAYGSVPVNYGDQSIADPVYGVDKTTFEKVPAYSSNAVDVMAVGNLPNELPRDASKYFGEQLIKYIFPSLFNNGSGIIDRATIVSKGSLTDRYGYLKDYAEGKLLL